MRRCLPALALVWLLVLCASAQAGFAPENDLIAKGTQMDPSGITTDPAGDTLLTWNEHPAPSKMIARARWLSASGELGPVVELGAPDTQPFAPVVASGPAGRAFVAWRVLHEPSGSDVAGRWVNRDGSVGPLLTISEFVPGVTEAVEVKVAVDPAGIATVVWRNEKSGFGAIELRRVRPDNSMTETVPKAGTSVIDLSIGALPDGGTIATWRATEATANVIGPDQTVGTQHQIATGQFTAGPELGLSPNGTSFVSWRESPTESTFAVRGIRLDAAGQPAGEELVLAPTSGKEGFETGGVGSDSAGNFLPTFARYPGNGTGVLYARGIDTSGQFAGPAEPVSDGIAVPESPQPVLFDSGAGAIVWNDYKSGKETGVNQTVGRAVNRAGAPTGDTVVFSKTRSPISGSDPALGVAAFFSTDESQALVRRFLEPPRCADGNGTVSQGKPTAIALACTGPGLETGQVTSPPGHGTLGSIDAPGRSVLYTPKPGFAGTDSFNYTLGNDGGKSTAATVTLKVGKDTVKPKIKRLRFVRKGKKLKFVVKLSEPGRLKIKVTRSRGPKRKPKAVGMVKSKKAGLKLTIPVKGKLAAKLRAGGRFRATAIATDLAGNSSKPKSKKFRVN